MSACVNPRCRERLADDTTIQLCPSCRFVGKIGLAIGAVIAGLLMKLFG